MMNGWIPRYNRHVTDKTVKTVQNCRNHPECQETNVILILWDNRQGTHCFTAVYQRLFQDLTGFNRI